MAEQMMPKTIQPYRMARESQRLQGPVLCDKMSRLQPLLHTPIRHVEVTLEGGMSIEGYLYVHCSFEVAVILVCQRCLNPVTYWIVVDSYLAPVTAELYEDHLPEDYEPLLTDGKIAILSDLVEEELLLNLPIVARHEFGKCPVKLSEPVHLESDNTNTKRPFADLKQLIHEKDKKDKKE